MRWLCYTRILSGDMTFRKKNFQHIILWSVVCTSAVPPGNNNRHTQWAYQFLNSRAYDQPNVSV